MSAAPAREAVMHTTPTQSNMKPFERIRFSFMQNGLDRSPRET
jgi:hypothetical protein